MTVIVNPALARLRRGELSLGLSVRLVTSVGIAQIAATAGYDWLAIDLEHAALTIADAAQISLAALSVGVAPIVRIKAEALDEGARALDAGAQGVLVPNVASAETARRMVDRLRHAPRGRRGWGGAGAHFRYAPPPLAEALSVIDPQILLAPMIETAEGLDQVEAIAATDGIDIVFVGATDLSIDLGAPQQFASAVMQRALERVANACSRAGKTMGVGGVQDEETASRLVGMGARFFAAGSDQAFVQAGASTTVRALAPALERATG